jgi:hypothetical protein
MKIHMGVLIFELLRKNFETADEKSFEGYDQFQGEGLSKNFRVASGGICFETWLHCLRFSCPFSIIPENAIYIIAKVYFPIFPAAVSFKVTSLKFITASLVYTMHEPIYDALFERHSFQQYWHGQASV